MRRVFLLLVLCAACQRGSSSQPSGTTSAVASPPPIVAAAPPSASAPVSPPARVPTALKTVDLQVDSPGRKPIRITLLRTEPDVGSALLNEETGELLAVQEKAEGETIQLKGPLFSATLTLPEEKKAGAIQLEKGPLIPIKRRSPEPMHAKIGANGPPYQDEVFLGPDGSETKVTEHDFVAPPEKQPSRFLIPPNAGMRYRPEFLYKDRWLPATDRRIAPNKVVLGTTIFTHERLQPGRELGCLVHGVVPTTEGALGAKMKQAWQDWARERCTKAGKDAIVELAYSTVLMAGSNLPSCEQLAVNEPMRCKNGASSIHMPINLRARVTSAAGSLLVEEALLLDSKAQTMDRLTPMATPKVAGVLKDWVSYGLTAPPWFPRKAIDWPLREPLVGPSQATLTVGPSTIDVVLPTAPLGLFLSSRHLAVGPRSTFVTAFTPSEATRRLTAALFVDL